jgi:prepilin-type N-terminal cleavage/methylation domain-containing protein
MYKSKTSLKGFTLIELLVTAALFSVILSIAVGALLSAQLVNTKLEQTQTVLDGVNLVTEVMVRDIRYGSYYYCDTSEPSGTLIRKSCPYTGGAGATVLTFKPTVALVGTTDPTKDRVSYYLKENAIYKNEYPYGNIMRSYQITSSEVKINTLGFYSVGVNSVLGNNDVGNASDLDQPLFMIVISGATIPKKKRAPVTFSVQTSTASRMLDN